MKILVDADGCPVVRIVLNISEKYDLRVVLVADTAHIFDIEEGVAEVVTVTKGENSADFALLSRCNKGDVVITQDYALAALCLAKGAVVINQNGLEYSNENIDGMLMSRFVSQKIRRAGGRTPHIKKRTNVQNEAFGIAFEGLINKMLLTNDGNMV